MFNLQPVDADDSTETLGAEDSFSEEEDVGDEEGDEDDEGDEGDVDEGGDEDLDDMGDLDPDEGRVAQPGSSGERGSFVIKIRKSKDPPDELHTPAIWTSAIWTSATSLMAIFCLVSQGSRSSCRRALVSRVGRRCP